MRTSHYSEDSSDRRARVHRFGGVAVEGKAVALSAGNEPAGVFAAGDVRCGSVKRVAFAVGEGSMAVQFVHEFLKTM